MCAKARSRMRRPSSSSATAARPLHLRRSHRCRRRTCATTPARAAGPVVAAVVPSPAANAARIVRIDAPKRAHISELVPVTVQVEARGLAGRTSTIVAHAAGLEVARATHKWTRRRCRRRQQAAINLAIPSLQTGPARFTISVIDGAKDSTNDVAIARAAAARRADVAVEVHDRPLRVLFVNGRPSWATRFIERALDRDPRFSVSSATRVSRGVTATSASAPRVARRFRSRQLPRHRARRARAADESGSRHPARVRPRARRIADRRARSHARRLESRARSAARAQVHRAIAERTGRADADVRIGIRDSRCAFAGRGNTASPRRRRPRRLRATTALQSDPARPTPHPVHR